MPYPSGCKSYAIASPVPCRPTCPPSLADRAHGHQLGGYVLFPGPCDAFSAFSQVCVIYINMYREISIHLHAHYPHHSGNTLIYTCVHVHTYLSLCPMHTCIHIYPCSLPRACACMFHLCTHANACAHIFLIFCKCIDTPTELCSPKAIACVYLVAVHVHVALAMMFRHNHHHRLEHPSQSDLV